MAALDFVWVNASKMTRDPRLDADAGVALEEKPSPPAFAIEGDFSLRRELTALRLR
jgi:hypothetical protein